MEIDLFTEGNISLPYEGISLKKIKSFTKKICLYLKLKDISITIVICDNIYIQKINKDYRKKNKPTDVISFAYRENPFPDITSVGANNYSPLQEILGDLYISLEKALENAKNYGVSFPEEIRRLIAHGILHLIGYDHERSRKDKKIMQEKEEEIFNYFSTAHSKPVLRKPSRVVHKSSSV
jgi:probable rRNA maturation factor